MLWCHGMCEGLRLQNVPEHHVAQGCCCLHLNALKVLIACETFHGSVTVIVWHPKRPTRNVSRCCGGCGVHRSHAEVTRPMLAQKSEYFCRKSLTYHGYHHSQDLTNTIFSQTKPGKRMASHKTDCAVSIHRVRTGLLTAAASYMPCQW